MSKFGIRVRYKLVMLTMTVAISAMTASNLSLMQGNISQGAVIGNSMGYVSRMTKTVKPSSNILNLLIGLPKSEYTYIRYISPEGKVHYPVTKKTLVQTSDSVPEAGIDYIGRAARAQIGPFPAFFYKSTEVYHQKWFRNFEQGRSSSALWASYKRPSVNDPCVGFALSLDEIIGWFSTNDVYNELVSVHGKPSQKSGFASRSSTQSSEFFARWNKSDRVVTLNDWAEQSIVLSVVFKPRR